MRSSIILFTALFAVFPSVAQGAEPAIAQFMRDSATLGFANLMLEKGLEPLSYDNFLEFKQVIASAQGGAIRITKLTALGQTVGATGNDPLTFYLDEDLNENIIETVRGIAGELLPSNYPFSVPPGGGVAKPPDFRPIPEQIDGVLLKDFPSFLQTDPRWATESLFGACIVGNNFWGGGCGPTSLAMVLKYFGKDVTPPQIGQLMRNEFEYVCGAGSSLPGLANIARDKYNVQYLKIPFSKIEAQLKEGHPIIGSFGCFQFFSGWCSGHISVIKGIGRCTIGIGGRTDTCLYFQDTFAVGGEVAFFANTVRDSFRINFLYAFYE